MADKHINSVMTMIAQNGAQPNHPDPRTFTVMLCMATAGIGQSNRLNSTCTCLSLGSGQQGLVTVVVYSQATWVNHEAQEWK